MQTFWDELRPEIVDCLQGPPRQVAARPDRVLVEIPKYSGRHELIDLRFNWFGRHPVRVVV